MPEGIRTLLAGVLIVATSIWLGGFVAIVVVARIADRTLGRAERIAFFRALGRVYLVIGTGALAVALATGAILVQGRPWDGTLLATALVAAALVATLAAGVVQARRITRLRRAALDHPADAPLAAQVRHRARAAALLRAGIGGLSLALVALGVTLAT